jgi:ribosomal RNA-processing protein 17
MQTEPSTVEGAWGGGKRKSASGNTRKAKKATPKSKLEKKRSNYIGKRGKGAPIVFDPDARKTHLQGFTERKKQRRSYGLAMQKVKDRKERLEQRKELKTAQREQVEEAEKQKEALQAAAFEDSINVLIGIPVFGKNVGKNDDDDDDKSITQKEEHIDTVQMYQDVQTQSQWGGDVIVTTSTAFPGDSDQEDNDSDDEKNNRVHQNRTKIQKTVDERQKFAGNVDKFLAKIKGKMPAKKKEHARQKGNHGAANMKGMAGSGDLKVAKSVLAKSQSRVVKGKNGAMLKGGKRKKK